MQKDTPSPYEFRVEEGDWKNYFFLTIHRLVYAARFKPSGYVFVTNPPWADATYEFVMEVVENPLQHLPPGDEAVQTTVIRIFEDFFRSHGEVVLYTCETATGRGAARARKFDGWFRQFNDDRFVKADHALFDSKRNQTYHSSVLLRANHPQRDEILAAFEALFGGLEAEK
jgi:hypothetical protein